MNKELLKGISSVVIGASCYGILTTLVRLAYDEGYTTAEVTVSQYTLGLAVLAACSHFGNKPERFFLGVTAAISYTISMGVANRIDRSLPPQKRSFLMLIGATGIVVLVGLPQLLVQFDVSIFWKWGLLLALFGSVLPPFLFNVGFPKTGIGLGSILSSIEIPVSAGVALILFDESVSTDQWTGITMIIMSVVVMNAHLFQRESNH